MLAAGSLMISAEEDVESVGTPRADKSCEWCIHGIRNSPEHSNKGQYGALEYTMLSFSGENMESKPTGVVLNTRRRGVVSDEEHWPDTFPVRTSRDTSRGSVGSQARTRKA